MTFIRRLPRFKNAYKLLEELKTRESWSRTEIEAFQLDRLNSLWLHATSTVPHYQRLAETHHLPKRFGTLDEFTSLVPALKKETVRDHPRDFLSNRPAPGQWRLTGGSTGTPTQVYWPHRAHRQSLCARYRCQMLWGIDIFDRQAMLWGHANTFVGGPRGLVARCARPIEDRLRGRMRLSAYRLSEKDLDRYIRRIQAGRPRWIYGYSSAVYILARRAAELGESFPSVRLVMLAGEPAYDWIVRESEKVFAAPTISEYGSMECGNIAHQWKDRKLHVRDDQFFLETVENGDGQYEIRTTVLNNTSFPLIRFAIGDLSDEKIERPARGFSTLSSVTGRCNDMVVARSGRLVHPMGVKHIFEQYPQIRRFKAHQDTTGHLYVQIETATPDLDMHKATQQLSELLEGYNATVEKVDLISGSPAGKHRWIVSELAENLRESEQ